MKDDPKRLRLLYVKGCGIPFKFFFDPVAAFRMIEKRAQSLPDEAFHKTTPSEELSEAISEQQTRRFVLPAAGAVALETLKHLEATLPEGLKAEVERLVDAAYITAAAALADAQRSAGPLAPVHLPGSALADPKEVMRRPQLGNARRLVIDVATDNARRTHPKGRHRPRGSVDSAESARALNTSERNREMLREMRASIDSEVGPRATKDERRAAGREMYSTSSPKRGAKAELHRRLAAQDPDGVSPDAIKRRRLRAMRRRPK